MNWDHIEGKWTQLKGSAQQHFGKLTDDDLKIIAGKRESLIGKLQERYGYSKDEAQKRADEWMRAADQNQSSHSPASHQQQRQPPKPQQDTQHQKQDPHYAGKR